MVRCSLVVILLASGWATLTAQETAPAPIAPTTRPSLPTEAQVREAAGQLGHPLHTTRQAAARRLAEWGPAAVSALRAAAAGSDLETALSARKLLAEMQAMLFLGAEIELVIARPEVGWDEPFDLVVRVHNPSPAPIRLPWPAVKPSLTTRPASADAAQVANLIDVADFLTVLGPDGTPLEPRIDPIGADAEVRAAVDVRAGPQPPFQWLEPGRDAELHVSAFNRGWARYPMFEAGAYHITLRYQPPWGEEAWVEEGLGHVASNTAQVHITNSAPPAVREAQRPLRLTLHRRGEDLCGDLTNLWDRPVAVNLNLGPEAAQFAQLTWEFRSPDHEEPLSWQMEPAAPGFRADRLRLLEPMDTATIAQISLASVQTRTASESITVEAGCALTLRYFHLATADELRDRLKSRLPEVQVPPSLFTGVVISEPLSLDAPDEKR